MEELREKVFDHLDGVAHRLLCALVTMNEAPYLRFSRSERGISEGGIPMDE